VTSTARSDWEAIGLLWKLYKQTRQAILRHAADYLYVNAVARMGL
jgi:hypothetical protein